MTKGDKKIICSLVKEYKNIPKINSVELSSKYFFSRAALCRTLNKCGFNSYPKFQNSIRFHLNIDKPSAIQILYTISKIIDSNKEEECNSEKQIYLTIYDMYCDLEENLDCSLNFEIYQKLATILLGFEKYRLSENENFTELVKTELDLYIGCC